MALIVNYSTRDTGVRFTGDDDRETYSVLGGSGNDTLTTDAGNDTIDGGKGNDKIFSNGGADILIGGKGNDTLTGGDGPDVFVYANGDGKDIISDYEEDDVIRITKGTITDISTNAKTGEVVFKIGKGTITLKDAADKIVAYEYAEDAEDNTGEKFYYPVDFNSKGTGATLKAEYRKETFNVEDFGDYADKIKVIDATAVDRDLNIIANANANKIYATNEDDFISAGKGKDTIEGNDGNDTIDGGAGNDSINGGAGKDQLTGGTGSDTFVYNDGDGNDTITDYSDTEGDKIQFGAGIVINDNDITTTSAGSVVFKVNGSKLTLKNAAEQEITYTDDNGTHTWSATPVIIDGTHALVKSTYTEDLFSTADYSSKIKTVDASSVSHDLEIVANKLANSITAGAGNNTINAGTGNDTITGGEGADVFVYANGDGKDIITDYEDGDLIKITSGTIKSISTSSAGSVVLKIGSGKITLKEAGDKLIAYEDADGVKHYYPVDINAAGTSVTLTADYGKDTFATSDIQEYADKIKTINASAVEQALAITGNKKANNIIGTGQDDEIDGAAGADTIYGGAGNDTLTGGAGKDLFLFDEDNGSDVITDFTTADKIQIVGGTSDNVSATVAANGNVIISHAGGTVTLQDAGKLTFDIYNDSNEVIASVNGNDPIKYNAAGTSATLTSYYTDDEFTADSTLITINAAAVTHALDITGNKNSNYITGTKQADKIDGDAGADTLIGGKGNDTLEGGKGADVFVYQSGDGKDVIEDYEDADRIQIIGGTTDNVTVTTASNGNVIVKHGSGRVTALNAATVAVTVIDENDNTIWTSQTSEEVIYNDEGTAATLTANFKPNTYGPDDYADYPNLSTIDAGAVNHDLEITGNKKANRIVGTEEADVIYGQQGKDTLLGGDGDDYLEGGADNDKLYGQDGNDILWGGKGSDSLTGGEGEDLFLYYNGDGQDVIYGYESGVDTIMLMSGRAESPIVDSKGDVTFKVGSGSIVVNGASDRYVEIVDSSGNQLQRYIPR